MSSSKAWQRLFAISERQFGVVTRACAMQAGLHRSSLPARAKRERWRQLTRSAWLVPGVPLTVEARIFAGLAEAGDGSLASHATAAHLHGIFSNVQATATVHLTVPHARRPSPIEGAVIHRSRFLPDSDTCSVKGLSVTTPARTLRDLSNSTTDRTLRNLMIDTEQRRLADLAALGGQNDRRRTAPGGRRYRRQVRGRYVDRSESALEADVRSLVKAAGFTPTAGPYELVCLDGKTIHLDIAFPEQRVAIECDGWNFHRDRRSFEVDRIRWRQAQALGWTIIWVTRQQLDDRPEEVIELLAMALQAAS